MTYPVSELNPVKFEDPKITIPVLDHGYVCLLDWMGHDLTPVEAARMSTDNPTGVDLAGDYRLQEFLWRHRHMTPFEMCELKIQVQAPIFVHNQWVRHRTQSQNVFSGRYSEMPEIMYTPAPERVQGQDIDNRQGSRGGVSPEVAQAYLDGLKDGREVVRTRYSASLADGISKELARIDLPLSQYTRFQAKANLRNWLHFLHLRLDPHAQYEIRVYAEAIALIVQALWPNVWRVFEEYTLHAVEFSRTERAILLEYLNPDGLEDFSELKRLAIEKGLSGGRLKEFMAKLGIPD